VGDKSQEFINHLREEKIRTQEERTKYTLQKLAFVTGLMSIGSLNLAVGNIDFSLLLYLAPWVAIAFDFYILGEDYSIKRIGAFLKAKSPAQIERQWEQWVANNRDPFAPWAMPVLTSLIFIGAALIAYQQPGIAQEPLFRIWVTVTGLPSWMAFAFYHRLRKRVIKEISQSNGSSTLLSDIVVAVKAANHQLNDTNYHKISRFFMKCQSDPTRLREIQQTIPEYGKQEFFICIDQKGQPIIISNNIIEGFRSIAERYPEYKLWFCEVTLSNGQSILAIARWLCHSVGFRHKVVHLFLDHPTLKDYTLLQVRAFDKAESPGRFDLPAAGHISDVETVETALQKEFAEELELNIEILDNLVQLGDYVYVDPSEFHNVEYRTVFYGQLNPHDWLKIHADSQEVAAIVSISISKLHEMIVNLPESVASGLRASFPLYLKYKSKQEN
jgi:isopentenyldiphosphate isomerase